MDARLGVEVPRENRSNTASRSSRRHAWAGVRHREAHRLADLFDHDLRHSPAVHVGVLHQVGDDAAHATAVGVHARVAASSQERR